MRRDIPALRAKLLPFIPPSLRALVAEKLDDQTESQLFKVAVDRMPTWHGPGILFLGDAAHTMSPSGGIGLNLAMIDAFTAADAFIAAVQENRPLDATVFQAIQDARETQIVVAQKAQLRTHGLVLKPRFALHVIFTMMGFFLPAINKKIAAAEQSRAPFAIRFPLPNPPSTT